MSTVRALPAVLVVSACIGLPGVRSTGGTDTADARRPIVESRPFSADSPFNQPIVHEPVIDDSSASMVRYLSRKGVANALIYEFGIPIWDADADTPLRPVNCTMDPAWGQCPFSGGAPVPAAAYPHTGSDGAMVVVSWSSGLSYEFWQFRRDGDRLVTSWGAVQPLAGSGFSKQGSSTASGASRLGGVIRLFELAAGRIPHALVMSIDNSCASIFRAPAVKTDGDSTRPDCIPQGARLQLDPSIDVNGIANISGGERIVAKALQEFGAYVIDKGGGPMGISFELARDATGANEPGLRYRTLGFKWDYFDMPHVPWSSLRVLRTWDGK